MGDYTIQSTIYWSAEDFVASLNDKAAKIAELEKIRDAAQVVVDEKDKWKVMPDGRFKCVHTMDNLAKALEDKTDGTN